jgi:hypothetical protein
MQMRKFREVLNVGWNQRTEENDPSIAANTANIQSPHPDFSPSAIELLPRAERTLLTKALWYISPRYWRQAVAAVGIYSVVLMFWGYLVR